MDYYRFADFNGAEQDIYNSYQKLSAIPLATSVVKNQEYKGLLPLGDGYKRGSAFENLYIPYPVKEPRNSRVNVASNDEEEMLKVIGEHTFACLELQLFSDTHPTCKQALEDYNRLAINLQKVTKEFEDNYYPLYNFGDSLNQYPWAWANSRWPWEQGGGM